VSRLLHLSQLHVVIANHHHHCYYLSVADSWPFDTCWRHFYARVSANQFHGSCKEDSRHSGERLNKCTSCQFHCETNQGHCASCQMKWGLAATNMCPCGKRQTMSHIVGSCPQTKLEGGLQQLHSAEDVATATTVK